MKYTIFLGSGCPGIIKIYLFWIKVFIFWSIYCRCFQVKGEFSIAPFSHCSSVLKIMPAEVVWASDKNALEVFWPCWISGVTRGRARTWRNYVPSLTPGSLRSWRGMSGFTCRTCWLQNLTFNEWSLMDGWISGHNNKNIVISFTLGHKMRSLQSQMEKHDIYM